MADIKTGMGGTVVDGTLVSFDPVLQNEKSASEGLKPDVGSVSKQGEQKDLSTNVKRTLRSYLSSLTSQPKTPTGNNDVHANTIPIADDGEQQKKYDDREYSETTVDEQKLIFAGTDMKASDKVVPTISPVENNQNRTGVWLPNRVDRLIQREAETKQHLKSLIQNNRFSIGSTGRETAAIDYNGTNPDIVPTNDVTVHHQKIQNLNYGKLAQLGNLLSLRASGELGSTNSGVNPTSGGQEASALLPSAVQLGLMRVEPDVLNALNAFNDLTDDKLSDENYSTNNQTSWGALNNVHDPYTGPDAIGMLPLSIALTAAVIVSFELLSIFIPTEGLGSGKMKDGTYIPGRSTLSAGSSPNKPLFGLPPDMSSVFGIKPTTRQYQKCVRRGVEEFFGGDLSGLLSDSPQYNVIVSRAINRSALQFVDKLKNFNSSNIVSGIKDVFEIANFIKNSKMIAAMNTFASVGDIVLGIDEKETVTRQLPDGTELKYVSTIDTYDDATPRASVIKNRLNDSLRSAWGTSTAKAMYIVPKSIRNLAHVSQNFEPFLGPEALSNPINPYVDADRNFDYGVNGRIDQSIVEKIENDLDAEYVPFYFHDLRTNEIIQFHAFLTNLSDAFNADYDKIDGIGRVDTIQHYKKTNRSIDLSFKIVATNEDDFDDMWTRINKLITLLYPQYTQGRSVYDENGNRNFTIPFSQLPGASPMVRMRIGDVIRSNYSKFALARLFGAGDPEGVRFNGERTLTFETDIDVQRTGGFNVVEGEKYSVSTSGHAVSKKSSGITISSGNRTPERMNILMNDLQYFVFTVQSVDLNSATVIAKPEIIGNVNDGIESYLMNKYSDYIDLNYTIPINQLNRVVRFTVKSNVNNTTTLENFMSSENNCIVKSFETTKGKGLAGFIESLSMTLLEQGGYTWETQQGYVAPKGVNITMKFAPVHDISPGIDHLGYNRAPVYPVGYAMMGRNKK